ncbi:MAG TPA: phage tail sheath C-terminal domain-containing protein [Gemmata sp.]|jgi:hypothetical protein|nr:phage tail sheath C-terminal domain-containing protein [Gemmata sp.]
MPTYTTPGVYVNIVPPTSQPIAGVGTTTPAIIGFGADLKPQQMPPKPGTTQTFNNGTVTITGGTATLAGGAKWPAVSPTQDAKLNLGSQSFVATRTGDTTLTLASPPPDNSTAQSFVLTITDHYSQAAVNTPTLVTDWSSYIQNFGDFQQISTNNNYLAHAVYGFFANGGTTCYIARFNEDPTATSMPATLSTSLQAALNLLAARDDVAMVCAPMPDNVPSTTLAIVQNAVVSHCELLQNRFAILDSANVSSVTGVTPPGTFTNGCEAFYVPWVMVADPIVQGGILAVPPSGHVAGVYARTDNTRGVFKAPANEELLTVLDLAATISDADQSLLNPIGVNCLRVIGGTPLVWGARTLSSDPQFLYVNVRRFLIFLRESIRLNLLWATFEPNSQGLWQTIKRSVSDFLLTQWQEGALLGDTPQQAYFVICDSTTNTPDVINQGMVVTTIGVAVVKPAEFVVFNIQQQTGS